MTDVQNSKKIRIMRAGSFIIRAQGEEVAGDYYASASLSIGSYWESSSTRRVGSGLNMAEEMLLMPIVLGIPNNDREFWKLRDEFFGGLEIKVPHKDGVELEISLIDNTKPMSVDNLPMNVHHYIRYRFAKGHPWVAISEEEARGNQLKHFYIHDEVVATADKANLDDVKDEALAYFLQVKKSPEKVKMMLTLLGTDWRDITGQTPKQEDQLRVEKLREILDQKPAEFKKLHEDKDFEIKYTIEMMLNTQVLRRIGSKILEAETGDSIGNYDETVQFFKDEAENGDRIAVLKAKLQEGTKANRKAKRTVGK